MYWLSFHIEPADPPKYIAALLFAKKYLLKNVSVQFLLSVTFLIYVIYTSGSQVVALVARHKLEHVVGMAE